jgi:DNA-binding transcriptional ArsR family regulator
VPSEHGGSNGSVNCGRRQKAATLGRALGHPIRLQILGVLEGEEASTAQLAIQLDLKPDTIRYHRDVLIDAGLIEKSRSERKRGAREQFFRMSPLPAAARQDVESLPLPLQAQVANHWLQSFVDVAAAVYELGTSNAEAPGIQWTCVALDDYGKAEVAEILDGFLSALRLVADHCAERSRIAIVPREQLLVAAIGTSPLLDLSQILRRPRS